MTDRKKISCIQIKPERLNRIAKIGSGHLYMHEGANELSLEVGMPNNLM
jgi:hypothetical protein